MKGKLLLILTALFLMTAVLGCSTYEGAGKDIEGMGKTMQKQSK